MYSPFKTQNGQNLYRIDSLDTWLAINLGFVINIYIYLRYCTERRLNKRQFNFVSTKFFSWFPIHISAHWVHIGLAKTCYFPNDFNCSEIYAFAYLFFQDKICQWILSWAFFFTFLFPKKKRFWNIVTKLIESDAKVIENPKIPDL